MKFLNDHKGKLYSAMRIVIGFTFMTHGMQKTLGLLGGVNGEGATAPFVSLIGLAGVIELVGGFLIMIGLFTGIAAFISSGQMAVAYFMAHQPQGLWPVLNGGEKAAMFAFVFLFIAAMGAGSWSFDALRKKA